MKTQRIIPPPPWAKRRMEAVRKQPHVTAEEAFRQAQASMKATRDYERSQPATFMETVSEGEFMRLRMVVSQGFKCRDDSVHGPAHWRRVENNALLLATKTKANITVIRFFALFHDAGRVNETVDDGHGKRGAEIATYYRGKIFDMPDEQFKLLYDACVGHTDGKRSDDPTIGTCWDADRFDLGRVGIVPDERFMSTEFGKEIVKDGKVNSFLSEAESQEWSQ